MKKHVLIDTDPGVDDALALLLALQAKELKVHAITTVCGNVDVHQATRNLFSILSLLPGPYPVVAQGAQRPLVREPFFANSVHGENGLGGERTADHAPKLPLSRRDAADEILYHLETCTQPLSIVTLGPLTNIALALQRNPGLSRKIEELIVMGGAYAVPGNITPAAEFNIFADPHAAGRVFQSGIPIRAVGLDVTREVRLDRRTLQAWAGSQASGIRRRILDWTAHTLDFMQASEGVPAMPLHDPLAVLICMDPGLAGTEPMHVQVETQGESTLGMTLADRRPIRPEHKKKPNVRVCTCVDSERCLRTFLEGVA